MYQKSKSKPIDISQTDVGKFRKNKTFAVSHYRTGLSDCPKTNSLCSFGKSKIISFVVDCI